MTRAKQNARIREDIAKEHRPFGGDRHVEELAVAAWIAVDRLTNHSPRALRQNRIALFEMRDKIGAMIAETNFEEGCERLERMLGGGE